MRKSIDHVNQLGPSAARSAVVAGDDVLELMHSVMHRLRHRQHEAMRDDGPELTPMEGRVLGFFARHPGATQGELAAHSGRDKGQLARLLTGLKARGLLTAEIDAADRRVTRLSLAPQAQAHHQAVLRQRKALAAVAVAGMAADEQAQLARLLRRVLDNLQPDGG